MNTTGMTFLLVPNGKIWVDNQNFLFTVVFSVLDHTVNYRCFLIISFVFSVFFLKHEYTLQLLK